MKIALSTLDSRLYVRQDGLISRDRDIWTPGRISSKGYHVVTLRDRRTLHVHRLIADAFVPNPDGRPLVTHRDGNRRNNHYTNLEWILTTERLHRSLSSGRVLTPNIVRAIRRHQQLGYPPTEIARVLRLAPYHVARVLSGRSWGHIT